MTPELVERVWKIIPRLGSPHAGEVVATAAALGRLLEAERMNFSDLAEALAPLPVRVGSAWRPPSQEDVCDDLAVWTDIIDRCRRSPRAAHLPARDLGFLEGVRAQVVFRAKPPSIRCCNLRSGDSSGSWTRGSAGAAVPSSYRRKVAKAVDDAGLTRPPRYQ